MANIVYNYSDWQTTIRGERLLDGEYIKTPILDIYTDEQYIMLEFRMNLICLNSVNSDAQVNIFSGGKNMYHASFCEEGITYVTIPNSLRNNDSFTVENSSGYPVAFVLEVRGKGMKVEEAPEDKLREAAIAVLMKAPPSGPLWHCSIEIVNLRTALEQGVA